MIYDAIVSVQDDILGYCFSSRWYLRLLFRSRCYLRLLFRTRWYLRLLFQYKMIFIPPTNFVCRGYTVFTSVRSSVRASVRPSVTLCFLNNSKSHCWIFIKPCKHVHICKTNTLDKKVRARGQFY